MSSYKKIIRDRELQKLRMKEESLNLLKTRFILQEMEKRKKEIEQKEKKKKIEADKQKADLEKKEAAEKILKEKKEKQLKDFRDSIGKMNPAQVAILLESIGFDNAVNSKTNTLGETITDPRINTFLAAISQEKNITPENLNDTAYRIANRIFPDHNKIDLSSYEKSIKEKKEDKFKTEFPRQYKMIDTIRQAASTPAEASRYQQLLTKYPKMLASFMAYSYRMSPKEAMNAVMKQFQPEQLPIAQKSTDNIIHPEEEYKNPLSQYKISTFVPDETPAAQPQTQLDPLPVRKNSLNDLADRFNSFSQNFFSKKMSDPSSPYAPSPYKNMMERSEIEYRKNHPGAIQIGNRSTQGVPQGIAKNAYDFMFNIPKLSGAVPNAVNKVIQEGEKRKMNDEIFADELKNIVGNKKAVMFGQPTGFDKNNRPTGYQADGIFYDSNGVPIANQRDGRPSTSKLSQEQRWQTLVAKTNAGREFRDSPMDRSPSTQRLNAQKAAERDALALPDSVANRIKAQTEAAKRDRMDRGEGRYQVELNKWKERNTPKMEDFNGVPSFSFGSVPDTPVLAAGITSELPPQNSQDPMPTREEFINQAMNEGRTIPNVDKSYRYFNPNSRNMGKKKYFYTEPEFYPELKG